MNSENYEYLRSVVPEVTQTYSIPAKLYSGESMKRGLRNADGTGVLAGVTKIGSVQGYVMEDGERLPAPGRLFYRGINVIDIVEHHRARGTFGYEEVSYLLLFGKLPTEDEFARFKSLISQARIFPEGYIEDQIIKAPARDIMNKLARATLALYSYDDNPDDLSLENLLRQSIELVGRFPLIVANAYAVKRHYFDNKSLYLHNPKENLSLAENFLRMIRSNKSYTHEEAQLVDLMMILHAEHGGGNNSTFVCRAASSTGTDTYGAVSAAVSSLKGPLHGGANAAVVHMLDCVKKNVGYTPTDDQLRDFMYKIYKGEANDHSGKIYGIGHAVYTESDPRAVTLKKYAGEMAEKTGRADEFNLVARIEQMAIDIITTEKNLTSPLCANIDLYSGFVYSMLKIPEDLYTPLFAQSRISGWCAHRIEEVLTGKRIMRPAYRSAVRNVPYVAMEDREP